MDNEKETKDINLEDTEEIFSDAEYEKAMEALNTSKTVRLKDKKEKKKEEQKAINEAEGKKPTDMVVVGCYIGIAVVIIGALLYFLIPKLMVKSLDMTVNDIKMRHASCSIYANNLSEYNLEVPIVQYPDTVENSTLPDNQKYFVGAVGVVKELNLPVIVEGTELKNNGKVTNFSIGIMLPSNIDSNVYSFYMLYFGSFFQVFDESLTEEDALTLAANAMNTFSDPGYYNLGDTDVAYRVQIKEDSTTFNIIELEFVNKDSLNADQFITVEETVAESAT